MQLLQYVAAALATPPMRIETTGQPVPTKDVQWVGSRAGLSASASGVLSSDHRFWFNAVRSVPTVPALVKILCFLAWLQSLG
ncbi:MAG TPA: hypothetical protein VD738_04995 [Nitrospira sp.]|nr:hypothetical protein [Nitrospira sp.]